MRGRREEDLPRIDLHACLPGKHLLLAIYPSTGTLKMFNKDRVAVVHAHSALLLPLWFQAMATHLGRCLQTLKNKQTNKFYSTVAYKGWFLLQKYFVLFCSKSFSYEWTCYSYYLLSDTSWKKGNIQDALFLMVEKFLICSGVFFSFSFPLPEERPPCFLELKVSRQGLSGCAEVRHWRTHTHVHRLCGV